MRVKLFIALGMLGMSLFTYAGSRHAAETSYPSYKGLVMAGYQGWFRGPQDGTNQGYGHYGTGKQFDEKHCTIDAWPDVSEYEKTYETSFRHADGRKARVFSSADKSTVDLHFKWMKDYGVDGVFVQRFVDYTRGDQKNSVPNRILENALEAASKYDRAIAVMYDLSGLRRSGEDCSMIIEDWKRLVDNQKVTNQSGTKTYLHHNGKPVVAIWGVGFPDRPYNIRNIGMERLIDFLQNDPVYGGCTVMLGVPTFWRTLESDCMNDPYLHTLIRKADIVLPWTIQRFSPLLHNDMDRFREDLYYRLAELEIVQPPLKDCKDDILPLAEFFRKEHSGRIRVKNEGFTEEAKACMLGYDWPGNVRELNAKIKRAVIVADNALLDVCDLGLDNVDCSDNPDIRIIQEKERIRNLLDKNHGNVSKTAAELGCSRTALYKKMKKLDLK